MKKLISILAALAVVITCSVGAMAAELPTIPDPLTNKIEKNAEDAAENAGLYTVNLTDVAAGQEQTTILAVKGDTIEVGTIEYIGQSADTTFNFDLRNTLADNDTVYVLAGGSEIPAQYFGYIGGASAENPAPSTYTISGTVTGYYASTSVAPTVTLTAATATDESGNALVYNVLLNSDGTFSQEVVADTYTLYASKDSYHTTYTVAALDATAGNVAYAEDITVCVGNVDGRGAINAADVRLLTSNFNARESTSDNWAEIEYLNLDERGAINAADIRLLTSNFNSRNVSK